MAVLPLVFGPHPIFRQTAAPVAEVDDAVRWLIDDMFDTLYAVQGLGMAATLVGVLRRVVTIDLAPGGKPAPLAMVNPEITWRSDATQSFEEGSLSFPFITAEITRPQAIRVRFLDRDGAPQELAAEGFLAQVIQHEAEYLDGRTFLDHLSKMKRDMLLKKMQKQLKHRALQPAG